MAKCDVFIDKIREWEYCYCKDCDQIRYASDLVAIEEVIICRRCGHANLETPLWVHHPHEKAGAVKCARAGKGINLERSGYDCKYRCSFRMP